MAPSGRQENGVVGTVPPHPMMSPLRKGSPKLALTHYHHRSCSRLFFPRLLFLWPLQYLRQYLLLILHLLFILLCRLHRLSAMAAVGGAGEGIQDEQEGDTGRAMVQMAQSRWPAR